MKRTRSPSKPQGWKRWLPLAFLGVGLLYLLASLSLPRNKFKSYISFVPNNLLLY